MHFADATVGGSKEELCLSSSKLMGFRSIFIYKNDYISFVMKGFITFTFVYLENDIIMFQYLL